MENADKISCVSFNWTQTSIYTHKIITLKRYIWRVKIFIKTIHKAWNILKLSEQSLEDSAKNSVLQFSIDRMLFFDWSTTNQIPIESCRNSKIISFNISIDQTKVSTNRNSWNLNFQKENSRIWVFTLFILQMNTLQPYIIITTYPCIYLYIQQQLTVKCCSKNYI